MRAPAATASRPSGATAGTGFPTPSTRLVSARGRAPRSPAEERGGLGEARPAPQVVRPLDLRASAGALGEPLERPLEDVARLRAENEHAAVDRPGRNARRAELERLLGRRVDAGGVLVAGEDPLDLVRSEPISRASSRSTLGSPMFRPLAQ